MRYLRSSNVSTSGSWPIKRLAMLLDELLRLWVASTSTAASGGAIAASAITAATAILCKVPLLTAHQGLHCSSSGLPAPSGATSAVHPAAQLTPGVHIPRQQPATCYVFLKGARSEAGLCSGTVGSWVQVLLQFLA